MSRLIDADALAKECCGRRYDFESCEKCIEEYAQDSTDGIGECDMEFRGEDVQNAPTIAAIPVEWLIERANDPKRAPLYRRYAQMLYEEWQKEQEAR